MHIKTRTNLFLLFGVQGVLQVIYWEIIKGYPACMMCKGYRFLYLGILVTAVIYRYRASFFRLWVLSGLTALEAFWSFWDVLQKIGHSKQKCHSVLQTIDNHIVSVPCSLNTPILKVIVSPIGLNATLSAMMLVYVLSIIWNIQPWNRKYLQYGLFLIGLGANENIASADNEVNKSVQKIARMETSKTYDSEARRLYEAADQKAKEYREQAKEIGGLPSQDTVAEAQKVITNTSRHRKGSCKGKCPTFSPTQDREHKLQVCMSFSVPIQVWKELNNDLMQHRGVFVLKGIPNNSFQTFTEKILEFRKHGITAPIRIDPKLFDRHQITQVPVFVVNEKEEVHTVSGTVTIPYVLEFMHNRAGVEK